MFSRARSFTHARIQICLIANNDYIWRDHGRPAGAHSLAGQRREMWGAHLRLHMRRGLLPTQRFVQTKTNTQVKKQQDEQAEAQAAQERLRLKQLSDARAAQWPDTRQASAAAAACMRAWLVHNFRRNPL